MASWARLRRSTDDVGGVLRHRPADVGGVEHSLLIDREPAQVAEVLDVEVRGHGADEPGRCTLHQTVWPSISQETINRALSLSSVKYGSDNAPNSAPRPSMSSKAISANFQSRKCDC